LPGLDGLKGAKHTKGEQGGFKAERSNIRVLPKGWFKNISSVDEVYEALFGAPLNGLHTKHV